MTTSPNISSIARPEQARVYQELDEICAGLPPGERVPTHRELMQRLNASERSVLRALEELQRQGRIIRKNGVGTFVAERREADSPVTPISSADSRTIVAIAKPDQSFFDRCMDLLFRRAEAADLTLTCRVIDPETMPEVLPPPASERPLGFLLFGYRLAPVAKQLQDAGCRVVVVGVPPAGATPEIPSVYGDHEQGGYLATRHLLDLGHRRIAFVGDTDLKETLRWSGHVRALQEARREGLVVHASVFGPEDVAAWARDPERAAACFRRPEGPIGVLAWNDREAVKLLTILTRAGVKVPEDVSLVGYDDLPEGRWVYPSLTTIDHAVGQQIQAALSLLMRPAAPPATHSVVVLPVLVPRDSTTPPQPAEE